MSHRGPRRIAKHVRNMRALLFRLSLWQVLTSPHNATTRTNTHSYFLPFTGRCRATERVEASGTPYNGTGTRVGEGGTLRNFLRLSVVSGRRLVHVRVPLRSRALHTFSATFLEIVPYLKL